MMMEYILIGLLTFLNTATITHLILSCVFILLLIGLVAACASFMDRIS